MTQIKNFSAEIYALVSASFVNSKVVICLFILVLFHPLLTLSIRINGIRVLEAKIVKLLGYIGIQMFMERSHNKVEIPLFERPESDEVSIARKLRSRYKHSLDITE